MNKPNYHAVYFKTKEGKAAKKRADATYYATNKHKRIAKALMRKALLSGEIKKENCLQCGSSKSEAHHEDYYFPLLVVWLCDKHHKERHKILNKFNKLRRENEQAKI